MNNTLQSLKTCSVDSCKKLETKRIISNFEPSNFPEDNLIDSGTFNTPIVEPSTSETPEISIKVPHWIKNNAGLWATDQITDSDFLLGVEYLIQQDIIPLPAVLPASGDGIQDIPGWVKNNAGWWAEGMISNNDFVKGIQYLVENGIVQL